MDIIEELIDNKNITFIEFTDECITYEFWNVTTKLSR